MKVLIQTRPNLSQYMTGDVTQIRKTAEALEEAGVSVSFSDSMEPDYSTVDVVHLFSTLSPYLTYTRLRYLIAKGVPNVVSTIYWAWLPGEERTESRIRLGRLGFQASNFRAILRRRLGSMKRVTPQRDSVRRRSFSPDESDDDKRKYIYENAGVLLPNSRTEYDYLEWKFQISNDFVVVPNAVDENMAGGDPTAFELKYGVRDFILCCAVVQIRKNQIRLIQAAEQLDVPIVLIGPSEPKYLRKCLAVSTNKTLFLGELRGADLRDAFAACRAHALVSFYETPGLASLEAVIAGKPIVVSDRGCTKEYFGNHAFYCEPTSVDSIAQALDRAIKSSASSMLIDRTKTQYTWKQAAARTLEGYELAIRKSR